MHLLIKYIFTITLLFNMTLLLGEEKTLSLDIEKCNQGDAEACVSIGKDYNKKKENNKAFPFFKKGCDLGSKQGCYWLGWCYVGGRGVDLNHKKAFEVYSGIKEINDGSSINNLAWLYQYGKGTDINLTEAIRLYEKAVDLNSVYAMESLANIYKKEKLKDSKKVVKYYKKACELKSQKNCVRLGSYYRNELNDLDNAFKYVKKGADLGSPWGMNYLGWMYEEGKGTNKDIELAIKNYEKSADLNFTAAMTNLALLYKHGEVVEQDINKSIYYYEKAIANKSIKAMTSLAELYESGEGIKKDMEKAMKYYKLACELDDSFSCMTLGNLFYKNNKYKKAFTYIKKSADLSNPQGLYNISWMYKNGNGTEIDLVKASEAYEQAEALGFTLECRNILYFSNDAIKPMPEEIIKICKQELDNNFVSSGLMYYLSLAYQEAGNFEERLYWLKKASDNGYSLAKLEIGNIYRYFGNDMSKALLEYKDAANNNVVAALFELGKLYENGGNNLNADINKAIKYYKTYCDVKFQKPLHYLEYLNNQTFNKRRTKGCEALVRAYYKNEQYDQVLKHAKQLIDSNISSGYYYLGKLYEAGKVVNKDIKKAIYNYEKADELGHLDAGEELGNLYFDLKEYEKSFSYLNHLYGVKPKTIKNIAWMYWYGKGTDKNANEGAANYKKACESGSSEACESAGDIAYFAAHSPSLANEFYEKSIQLGNKTLDNKRKVLGLSEEKNSNFSLPFIQLGHSEFHISSMVLSNGEKQLITTDGEQIKLWNIDTRKLLKTVIAQKVQLLASFHKDDQFIAATSDGVFQIRSTITGDIIRTVYDSDHQHFTDLKVTPDDKYVLIGGDNNYASIIDINTGDTILKLQGHKDKVTTFDISKDGNYALTGSYDNTIKLWKISTGKEIETFKGHSDWVFAVSFSPDTKYIYSASRDKSIKMWDIQTGKLLKTLEKSTSGLEKTIEINKKFSLEKQILLNMGDFMPFSLSPSSDNKDLYVGYPSGKVLLWDLSTGKVKKVIDTNQGIVNNLLQDFKSNILLTSGNNSSSIKIYNLEDMSEVDEIGNSGERLLSLIATPDSKKFVTGGFYGGIVVWDLINGKMLGTLNGYSRPVRSFSISSDGKRLLSGSDVSPPILWDLSFMIPLQKYSKCSCAGGYVAVTPNEKYQFVGSALGTFSVVNSLNKGRIKNMYFYEDSFAGEGLDIASSSRFALFATLAKDSSLFKHQINLRAYLFKNKKFQTICKDIGLPTAIEILPDDKSVLVANDGNLFSRKDGSIFHQYLIRNGKQMQDFLGHYGRVDSLSTSEDGTVVLSGGFDGQIILWNVKTGEILKKMIGHIAPVRYVKIIKSGKYGLSASDDRSTKLWNLKTGEEMASFISFDSGDWIVMTPEGYFNGSRGSVQHLNITRYTKQGMEPFDFSQLYDHFFRPDLVKLKLSGEEEEYQRQIRGLTYKEALKNPPPKVSLLKANGNTIGKSAFAYDEFNTTKEKIDLTFNVNEHDNGGIGLIRVYQEGKLIQTIGEGKINREAADVFASYEERKKDKTLQEVQERLYLAAKQSHDKSAQFNTSELLSNASSESLNKVTNTQGDYTITSQLQSGANEFCIEAFNKTNTVTSYKECINVHANIPKRKPNFYGVVIGVNEFKGNYQDPLRYSQKDAKDLKETITAGAKGLYGNIEIKELLGKEVSQESILTTLKEIQQKAKVDDTILFFISTHGMAYKGNLYLLPYNGDKGEEYISFQKVFDAMQGIPSLKQLFIVDACHSGQASDIMASVYDSRASVLAKSAGVHLLMATTRGTSAFESQDPKIKNSLFTHQILKMLKDTTTDKNKDNTISIIELSNQIKEQQNNKHEAQYPIIRNVGGDILLKEAS